MSIPNAPNLRFPEFTEEWISCKVGDYGKIITGSTPPTSDNTNYADGTHLWASPMDLGQTKYVIDTQTKLSSIGFGKTRKLPAGSVLVTCIGSTIGKMGMAATEMSTNQQINSIVVDSQYDNNFVYYALQSRFPRYLTSVAVQAVPIMSKSSFEKLQNYRTALEEQKKIGILLNHIDERIATQIGAIEKLESLMSVLYGMLFSETTGKTVPLSKVCSIKKGQQVNGELLSEQGDYYVMNGGISPSGYYNQYNTEADTISISEGGNSCGYVQFNRGKFWSGGHCYTVHPNSINNLYLYHFLKSKQQDIMRLRIGSGLPNIQKKDIESFPVFLPQADEQARIVTILNAVESKLSIERQLLDCYKAQKQYLLSQMFI